MAPQPALMFVPSGRAADRGHLGAEAREGLRCELRVGAVGTVDRDPQAGEIGAEPLDDVLEIAVGGDADVIDAAAAGPGRLEQRLDLLLRLVGQLAAVTVEELDPVVLGRIVRRGDDDAEVEREQSDGRSGQDAGEHGVAACLDDPSREGPLELRAGCARVAADEDAPAAGPERRGPAEPLDEVDGQILTDHATDAVGPEIAPQGRASASRTAAPCAPCAVRPSCARPDGRRA